MEKINNLSSETVKSMICNIVLKCAGGSTTALVSHLKKNMLVIQEMLMEPDK